MTPRGYLACISVLLMLAGCLLILAHTDDSDASSSGQCGDNVYWTYYHEQSRLVIEGTGGPT